MKETKHNRLVCFVLKSAQNRRIYAIISIHKTILFSFQRWFRFVLSFLTKHSCLKFKKSNLNHQENIIFEQESNQKLLRWIRNLRSNFHFLERIEIIYLFREFFEILFIFLTKRLFFHFDSIVSISSQKIVQYSIWRSISIW